MIISIIVAMDENQGIGINNRLPWHLSEDLKRFKRLTMGHHLILGRRTFESIGQPLPGREIVILSHQQDIFHDCCSVASSLDDALQLALDRHEKEVFIAGGGQVYAQALPVSDRIYLTRVHTVASADTFFPKFDSTMWVEEESTYQDADRYNTFATTFKLLKRKKDKVS